MILLTAALFAMGFVFLGVLSGLVLSGMTAVALALFGLAWSMTGLDEDPDHPELVV